MCLRWHWCKEDEGALFLSAPSLRRFGDPTLESADDFALALSHGLFTPAGRHALQAAGAAALYDSHSGVHKGE
jgi:hypothetical protein